MMYDSIVENKKTILYMLSLNKINSFKKYKIISDITALFLVVFDLIFTPLYFLQW